MVPVASIYWAPLPEMTPQAQSRGQGGETPLPTQGLPALVSVECILRAPHWATQEGVSPSVKAGRVSIYCVSAALDTLFVASPFCR